MKNSPDKNRIASLRSAANHDKTSAELVGAWGMQIRWNDGHETGIYAWSMLRAWRATDADADPNPPDSHQT